jgi:DNA-binding MarR family transcriptional regulator
VTYCNAIVILEKVSPSKSGGVLRSISAHDTISIVVRRESSILKDADYQSLSEFRYQIRKFLCFSEQASKHAGIEPRQHQFLLALKGMPEGRRPRIADLAERLKVKHHSAVELVNRLAKAGYVRRHHAADDRREVLVSLTPRGAKLLHALSLHHRTELRLRGPALIDALNRVFGQRETAVNSKNGTNRSVRKSVAPSQLAG